MVIWVTGLSGAGKTTLCKALYAKLKKDEPATIMIDSEVLRGILDPTLSYQEEDRKKQVKKVQSLAKLLADQDLTVIVAILYSHPDLLNWNRQNFTNYFEVYLNAPLDLVKRRDPKGIYQSAARGEMKHVVGVDLPWHTPLNPNLIVNSQYEEPPEVIADQIISSLR